MYIIPFPPQLEYHFPATRNRIVWVNGFCGTRVVRQYRCRVGPTFCIMVSTPSHVADFHLGKRVFDNQLLGKKYQSSTYIDQKNKFNLLERVPFLKKQMENSYLCPTNLFNKMCNLPKRENLILN